MFLNEISKDLQKYTDISIDILVKFYGLDAKIFYPKPFEGKSHRMHDLEFNEDYIEAKVLIPDVFKLSKTSMGGIRDNLFQETFFMYTHSTHLIPFNSKILIASDQLGPMQFLVEDKDSVHLSESIYTQYTLSPYSLTSNLDFDERDSQDELGETFLDEIEDNDTTIEFNIVSSDENSTDSTYKYRPME